MEFGWLSLLPPLAAIGLAIATRRVIVSLTIAVFVGVLIFQLAHPGQRSSLWIIGIDAPWSMLKDHLWHAITGDHSFTTALMRSDHLRVYYFTMLFGALVGILHASGSMRSFVLRLSRHVRDRRGGQLFIWLSGMLIFFDDYANTLLVGTTMRSTADRMRLSREKLAYLVDSTAAPVAGLSLISTWVATEISYMSEGLAAVSDLGEMTGFDLFLRSLPYRFYPIFSLVLVVIVAWTGRDFGPMKAHEQRAMHDNHHDHASDQTSDPRDAPAWVAIVSIGATVAAILFVLFRTGSVEQESMGFIRHWGQHIGNADPYSALIWGGFVGSGLALAMSCQFGGHSFKSLALGAIDGIKNLLPAMVVLLMAWTLSRLTTAEFLNTQGFLGDWIRTANVAATWIPTLVFMVAGFVAFATGTSWGTMGLLVPLSIPIAVASSGDPTILYATAGAVLSGAIFGDHCSPISDTTVLSSQASGCDHISHVKTQLPYAMLAAAISIAMGSLPTALGISPWILLVIGSAAMVLTLRIIGKTP